MYNAMSMLSNAEGIVQAYRVILQGTVQSYVSRHCLLSCDKPSILLLLGVSTKWSDQNHDIFCCLDETD